jgi:hypothetical protein
MAETIPAVMEFVEKEIAANPDAKSTELFEKAKKVDPSISTLSQRQFHARYPLQVHRKKAPPRPRRSRSANGRPVRGKRQAAKIQHQQAVRDVLYRFAQELTASSEPAHLVKVMADIDSYVEEVIAA